jgi:hypothetical protein
LILTGTFSYFGFDGWDDLDRDPAELGARLVPELGNDYTPSTEQLARWQTWCRAAGSAWGSGEALRALLPSVRSIRQLAMVERMSASPGMARAALEAVFRTDVRSILPTVTAPTLVIHARDEVIPVQEGRYIADHIPGARLVEVDGNDHVPWLADPDMFTTEIEEFLTGGHAAPSHSRRALRTEIRVGIHTGECELLEADIGGIAVHIAARILGQAGAGEILVSGTVRDLVVGSGTGFEDRGSVELRGVPGTWQLLAVDRHGPRAGSPEAELVSMPTPGRRTAMRRSDRTVEAIARRAPWILRGMARLAPATGRR